MVDLANIRKIKNKLKVVINQELYVFLKSTLEANKKIM